MKYCKICGAELPDEAVFCTTCGAVFEEEKSGTTVLGNDDSEKEISGGTTVLSDDGGTTVLDKPADDEPEETPVEKEPEVLFETPPEILINDGADKTEPAKKNTKIIIIAAAAVVAVLIVGILIGKGLSGSGDSEAQDDTTAATTTGTTSAVEESGVESLGEVVLTDTNTGDSVSFEFPLTVEEFSRLSGIKLSESLSNKVEPDEEVPYDSMLYSLNASFNAQDFIMYYKLPKDAVSKLGDCIVASISLEEEMSSSESLEVCGISLNSTKKDVVSLYGNYDSKEHLTEEAGYSGNYYQYYWLRNDASIFIYTDEDKDDAKLKSFEIYMFDN